MGSILLKFHRVVGAAQLATGKMKILSRLHCKVSSESFGERILKSVYICQSYGMIRWHWQTQYIEIDEGKQAQFTYFIFWNTATVRCRW